MASQDIIAGIDSTAFPGATPAQWTFFEGIARSTVTTTAYGPDLYDYALALYTAHLMARALPQAAVAGSATSQVFKAVKVGGASMSFQSAPTIKVTAGTTSAFLQTTKWGELFEALSVSSASNVFNSQVV